jgi:hypothetical protein
MPHTLIPKKGDLMKNLGLFALVLVCGVVLSGWGACRRTKSCDCCKSCDKCETCSSRETVISPDAAKKTTTRTSGTDNLK